MRNADVQCCDVTWCDGPNISIVVQTFLPGTHCACDANALQPHGFALLYFCTRPFSIAIFSLTYT